MNHRIHTQKIESKAQVIRGSAACKPAQPAANYVEPALGRKPALGWNPPSRHDTYISTRHTRLQFALEWAALFSGGGLQIAVITLVLLILIAFESALTKFLKPNKTTHQCLRNSKCHCCIWIILLFVYKTSVFWIISWVISFFIFL